MTLDNTIVVLESIEWERRRELKRLEAAITVGLTPPAEYLPPGEEPKVFGRMNAPPGYNLPTMREIGYQVQKYFLPFLDDDPIRLDRGETAVPAIEYLILSIRASGLFLIAEPKNKSLVDALMDAIDLKYGEFAGMRAFTTRGSIITSNNGGTRSIDVDISGLELEPIFPPQTSSTNLRVRFSAIPESVPIRRLSPCPSL